LGQINKATKEAVMTKDKTEQCFSSIENKLAQIRRILQKLADSSCTGEEKNGSKE